MTTSNRSPAFAHAGSMSAALPTSAIDVRLAGRRRLPGHRQRLLRRVREVVHVADLVAALRPVLVHLDRDADALVHRHRQRLGATHPAEARREHHPPAQRPAEVLARELRERLVGALEDPLGADVDPGPGGHLAVHHQALASRGPGRRPRWPTCRRGWSWRSGPAAPTRWCGRPRPACPTGRGASRRRRGGGARGRWRRTPPSCGPPGRFRRRRRGCPGPPPPPDRGCS